MATRDTEAMSGSPPTAKHRAAIPQAIAEAGRNQPSRLTLRRRIHHDPRPARRPPTTAVSVRLQAGWPPTDQAPAALAMMMAQATAQLNTVSQPQPSLTLPWCSYQREIELKRERHIENPSQVDSIVRNEDISPTGLSDPDHVTPHE